jgi:hypothetical protein
MCGAQLKLNLEKCVFGISRGKLLGCLVSVKGIKANPDKIKAIVHMKPPGSRKEVQRLTGRIAALNQFMAKIAERSLPFFKVLRGSDTFEWGPEQKEAFEALKEYIQKLPTLASPQPDQSFILYVSVTHTAVSEALVLYFRSSRWLKEVLLRDEKNMLCCSHEHKEAQALFRSPQSQSPDEPVAEQHLQKSGFLGQNRKMGHGTSRACNRF